MFTAFTQLELMLTREYSLLTAQRVGGRFRYLWFATIFHGFVVESISFAMPDIDNYWHSQTVIILLGRRLPLHILMLCN